MVGHPSKGVPGGKRRKGKMSYHEERMDGAEETRARLRWQPNIT